MGTHNHFSDSSVLFISDRLFDRAKPFG